MTRSAAIDIPDLPSLIARRSRPPSAMLGSYVPDHCCAVE